MNSIIAYIFVSLLLVPSILVYVLTILIYCRVDFKLRASFVLSVSNHDPAQGYSGSRACPSQKTLMYYLQFMTKLLK